MKIPLYTSQGQMSRDTPGRSISARMSMAGPRAIQEQGKVLGTAISEANQFATMRYNMITEINRNEAIFGAKEEIANTYRDLLKGDKLLKALDTENNDPSTSMWSQSMTAIKERLIKDKIGTNRASIANFKNEFNKMEISSRFRLRDEIDTKLQKRHNAAVAASFEQATQEIANGDDLSQVKFLLAGIGATNQRLSQLMLGNPDVLKAKEQKVLFNGVLGSIRNFANYSETPSADMERFRQAIREGDASLAPEGASYQIGLLNLMSLEDQAKIIGTIGRAASYIDMPTEEEKNKATLSVAAAKSVGKGADFLISSMAKGRTVSDEEVVNLEATLSTLEGKIDDTVYLGLIDDLASVKIFQLFQSDIKKGVTPKNIDNIISQQGNQLQALRDADQATDMDEKAFQFLLDYKDGMLKGIEEDPIAYVSDTQAGNIKITTVDISPDAFLNGSSGIEDRLAQGNQIKALYDLDHTPLLNKNERDQVLQQIRNVDAATASSYLGALIQSSGEAGPVLLENLRRAGLQTEYVEAMYVEGSSNKQIVTALAETTIKSLEEAVISSGQDKSEIDVLEENLIFDTQEYYEAFTAGNFTSANQQFQESMAVAKKVGLFSLSQGMSAKEAANKAMDMIFPDRENVYSSRGNFIVPKSSAYGDPDKIAETAQRLAKSEVLLKDIKPIAVLNDPRLPEFADQAVNIAAITSMGEWLNNSTGDGLVLHYRIGDERIPVRNLDGSFYDIKFLEFIALENQIKPKRSDKSRQQQQRDMVKSQGGDR